MASPSPPDFDGAGWEDQDTSLQLPSSNRRTIVETKGEKIMSLFKSSFFRNRLLERA